LQRAAAFLGQAHRQPAASLAKRARSCCLSRGTASKGASMSLSVSQVLSDTWAALKGRFWALIGMWLAFFAIIMGAVIAFLMAIGGGMMTLAATMENPDNAAGLGAGMFGLMVVFYLFYLLLVCAQNAALTALASPLREPDFGAAFGAGWRSAPTLLVVFVLLLIGYFIGALAFGVLAAAVSALGSAGTGIAAVLVLALVLYFACRLGLVFPVAAVEGVRNPFAAIGRSWAVTRGNVLPIFLAMVVFVAIAGVLFALLFVPLLGSLSDMSGGNAVPAVGAMVFLFFGVTLLSVIVAVAYAALLAAVHARLVGTGEQLADTFA
jgi:hypothetical protein